MSAKNTPPRRKNNPIIMPDASIAPKDGPLPNEWLLFRLSSLGDVVLATGVIRYLHQRFGWSFEVLTRQAFAPIFENNPLVRRVLCPSAAELELPGSLKYFKQTAAVHAGWGLLDLHGTLRSRLLGMMWRGPVRRYPKYTAERRKFLKERAPAFSAFLRSTSVTQRYALAVLDDAPPRADLLPQIYLSPAEEAAAGARLSPLREKAGSLIALHPYATHASKAWPREHWLRLIKMFEAARQGFFIVGQGEPLLPGDARDFTNGTGLRELAALLGQAELLISGDSGPMHLAGAAGTPVLGIFGPTTAEWGFFPSGPCDQVLELDLSCRPCSLHGAPKDKSACDGRCLRGISPELVFQAVQSGGHLCPGGF